MRLTARTKIDEMLKKYPFLLNFLVGLTPKFSRLKSPVMRKTIGKVATLQQAASFGGMSLPELLQKIQAEIKRASGEEAELDLAEAKSEPIASKEARLEVLKDIIRELHEGGDREELKRRFAELIQDVSPTEISEMEQQLIDEGMPEEEVKRLCDVHVQVFKESLESQLLPSLVPGHPLRTLEQENRALEKILEGWSNLLGQVEAEGETGLKQHKDALVSQLATLAEVEKHYLKKENQLFPLLESKGVSGPSKIMWAIHDDIRARLREFRRLIDSGLAVEIAALGRNLSGMISDMIYKEEKILFPMSLETLSDEDWARVKKGEGEVGYAWIEPEKEWKPAVHAEGRPPLASYRRPPADVELDTGSLTPEAINLILKSLPVDVTFVDENDTVRYYSASAERIFPRSPGVIGRRVQNCHPPASVHMVNRILDAFKEGRRDVAEFWIETKERFIHIRYFAVRDEKGVYKGCLEVSQDVTDIRKLKGKKRLLDWE